MFSKLKQFKDLHSQAKKLQGELATEFATGEAEWGKIKITLDGNQTITEVLIDPSLLTPDNKKALEQGILNATNEGIKKIQKIMAKKLQSMGGLGNIPGLSS